MPTIPFWLILTLFGLSACTQGNSASFAPVLLRGDPGFEFNLYRLDGGAPGSTNLAPVGLLESGVPRPLPAGTYFVANQCSQHQFVHDGTRATEIPLGHFELRFGSDRIPPGEDQTLLECQSQLSQQTHAWTNRQEFLVLPGETAFRIGKTPFSVFSSAGTTNPPFVELAPVKVYADAQPAQTPQTYSITPQLSEGTAEVMTAEIGKSVWLLPGRYTLEINGTQRQISVEPGVQTEVLVGVLRVETPTAVRALPPDVERDAFFLFLGNGVLLNLDTDYYMFPGDYTMNIGDSNLDKVVRVMPNEKTVVQTRLARIDVPPCPFEDTDCGAVPKLTIHRELQPFPLMTVEPNTPFIVFDEAYQYGVEGIRGILRKLPATIEKLEPESLAVAELKWELRAATGRTRTDLVRVEGQGDPTAGKSLDLLFSKPHSLYMPPGSYHLTYFVGDPSQERKKTRAPFSVAPGGTTTLMIPIFAERGKNKSNLAASPRNEKGKSEGLPTRLTPIRR